MIGAPLSCIEGQFVEVHLKLPVQRASARFGSIIAGCSQLLLGACSDGPTQGPVNMLTGENQDLGSMQPMTSAGGAGGAGGGSSSSESGLGGAVIVGGGGMVSSGAGGSSVMPMVDCSMAGTAPVTVEWDDVNDQAAQWYATPEALSVAENILYYQNDNRGWPKAIEMTARTAPRDGESTIDNDATTTQIDYLARVYTATGCTKYRDGALAGIGYLLEAQYDNGGWPQVFPVTDGYSSHITFNDNAMVHVLELLRGVAGRAERFAFADEALASSAAAAVQRGIGCILATQIVVNGTKTGWCAQHDEQTLEPAQARTYELPSLSGSEGAALFRFLMTIEDPSPEVRDAIESAATWFEAVRLTGVRIERTVDATQPTGEDRILVQDPAAPPLWARFYELGTNRPIFSSRCEVPECDEDPFFMRRYTLAEIDNERRVGYAWYGNWPAQLLQTTYPAWRERWAE
jgi:PelA/Pel-15E family pectate lyase